MQNYSKIISNKLLPKVKNPGQYIGGEVNQVKKDWNSVDIKVALVFPDVYAIGMSNIGYGILYNLLNMKDNILAERSYCPWLDAGEIMKKENIPLFSWESRMAIRDFDVVGITLQHELSYSNVLHILDLAGIPFRSLDRDSDSPLIVGGGPIADCCEPVADFFDCIVLGDGEEVFPELLEFYSKKKKETADRNEILLEIARNFDSVYVPRFYEFSYNPDDTIKSVTVTEEGIPQRIKRNYVEDMDQCPYPTKPLIANVDTPHNRIAIEIMRGCPGRCAFCHAGHTKGKLRYRSIENILDIASKSYPATGHDTVSLLSLSTSDYPDLTELSSQMYQQFEGKNMSISLPSLRVDKQLKDIPSQIVTTRKEGMTIAVETSSDIIRKAIGKKVTDSDLEDTILEAYKAGWQKIKLYFMIGFPGETEKDLLGIVKLASRLSYLRRQVHGTPASVTASISWFVPKPHTPLAWAGQRDFEYFMNARRMLIDACKTLKKVSVRLKFHYMESSILEAILSRGDRRLSKVMETAYQLGAKFDCWHECFEYDRYLQAMAQCGLSPDIFTSRERPMEEVQSWYHLGTENYENLYKRYQKILETIESESPDNA